MSEPGSFLSRWSRRKRDAVAPPTEEIAAEPPATETALADGAAIADEPAVADAPEPALSEEEIAQLPPVDEIAAATDLAPFLRAGVPRLIRNAALRRMWSVDPAIRDFLNDAREYAYDWNVPGGVPGSGPLLPMDDVAELLRRVVGGSGPEPDDAPAAEPADADGLAPDEPVIASEEGEGVRLATAASLPEPAPEIVIGVRPPTPGPDASPPERVLRRHGGAMPN